LDEDKLLAKLAELIGDLGWDYDRLSVSGQETYDKICSVINKIIGG